ncbi:MAG: ABC transporter permease [Chloroflexi bacterium]|nr:ABC transporter permease [Chloroflexota bacterium]
MQQYIIRRLMYVVLVLIGVSIVIFSLMRVVPGDVTSLILGESRASEAEVRALRQELGLDRPIHEQYLAWIWDLVRLDLGKSLWSKRPVAEDIIQRFPLTLQLAIMITVLTVVVAIPLGIVCAIRQDSWLDYFLRVFSIAGLSLPAFWLGTLVILFLVLWFRWMPPLEFSSILDDPGRNLQQLMWPAITAAYRQVAVTSRMTRSCMLEVLREDYIRTAWSKGLRERIVIFRHAMKNALIPVVTLIGMEFAFVFGGLVVTETVFSLPGFGSLLVDSIFHRDYPAIQATVLIMSTVVVLANVFVDIFYGWLDPRIRYS